MKNQPNFSTSILSSRVSNELKEIIQQEAFDRRKSTSNYLYQIIINRHVDKRPENEDDIHNDPEEQNVDIQLILEELNETTQERDDLLEALDDKIVYINENFDLKHKVKSLEEENQELSEELLTNENLSILFDEEDYEILFLAIHQLKHDQYPNKSNQELILMALSLFTKSLEKDEPIEEIESIEKIEEAELQDDQEEKNEEARGEDKSSQKDAILFWGVISVVAASLIAIHFSFFSKKRGSGVNSSQAQLASTIQQNQVGYFGTDPRYNRG